MITILIGTDNCPSCNITTPLDGVIITSDAAAVW